MSDQELIEKPDIKENNQNSTTKEINKSSNDYSIRELFKLKASGLSYREIEVKTGIPHETVYSRLSSLLTLADKTSADWWLKNKSTIFDNAELELLCDVLDPKKRLKSTQGNAAYSFDKIATHNRLEKGLSTENVSIQALIDDLDSKEQELIAKISHKSAHNTPDLEGQSHDKLCQSNDNNSDKVSD